MDKKVVLLTNSNIGLYRFRKELLAELVESYQTTVVSPNDGFEKEIQAIGVKYIDLPMDRRGINVFVELKLLAHYYRTLKSEKPDAVITYTIKPNIYGNILTKLLKIPTISTITGLGDTFIGGGLLSKIVVQLYRFSLSRAKALAFENEEDSAIFKSLGIIKNQKILQMPGAGVNLEEHLPLDYPQGRTVFLFISRYMKTKGIYELIEATKLLKQTYDFEMIFMGGAETDFTEKIDDTITDVGFQSDIKLYVKKAHAIVLPSYKEGMSNALLEAAAMGRPLITTNVSGCREALEDNGYLCEPRDVESLYEAMEKFINLPPAERERMANKSREKVEKTFDRRIVTEKMIDALGGII